MGRAELFLIYRTSRLDFYDLKLSSDECTADTKAKQKAISSGGCNAKTKVEQKNLSSDECTADIKTQQKKSSSGVVGAMQNRRIHLLVSAMQKLK